MLANGNAGVRSSLCCRGQSWANSRRRRGAGRCRRGPVLLPSFAGPFCWSNDVAEDVLIRYYDGRRLKSAPTRDSGIFYRISPATHAMMPMLANLYTFVSYLSADLYLTAAARSFAWTIMMNEISRISVRRHIRNSPFAMLSLRDFLSLRARSLGQVAPLALTRHHLPRRNQSSTISI